MWYLRKLPGGMGWSGSSKSFLFRYASLELRVRPLPGPLLRCHFPQVRPSVVPPADHCPGRCSDVASLRYDHRSYRQQTAAQAAAQIPLSSGTTIGRTPVRPPPGLQLRYRFLQVRPSVVPPSDRRPGRCSDVAFFRYDHRSYPQQTAAQAAAQIPLPLGTTIGRTPGRPLPGLLRSGLLSCSRETLFVKNQQRKLYGNPRNQQVDQSSLHRCRKCSFRQTGFLR